MDPGRPLPSDRQWDEHEIVYMFTEILQRARERSYSPSGPQAASQILFESIQRLRIDPSWEDIVPPQGRSIAQCRNLFQQFGSGSAPPAIGPSSSFALAASSEALSRKRPFEAVAPAGPGRVLKPKPATQYTDPSRFALPGSSMFPLSPLGGEAPSLAEPGRKKRGRPTKKEQEERRRQAEAESARRQSLVSPGTLTPHSAPFPPGPAAGPSGLGAPAPAATMTPQAQQGQPAEESNSGSSSSKKRRGGRGKAVATTEPAPPFNLPQRTAGYESPPRTAATRDRRMSVSTRSETAARTVIGSTAPESSTAAAATTTTASTSEAEERRQTRPRTWNETIGL